MSNVIGVWSGYEDNTTYRRGLNGLEEVATRRVHSGEVVVLDADVIHEVFAPTDSWSAAIHVYLGDLVGIERSEWADVSAPAAPLDGDAMERRWRDQALATGLLLR